MTVLWFTSALGQELLYTLASPNEERSGRFGYSVAGVGDVNGDGYPEFLVGAPHEDPAPDVAEAGRAYVFSGADGTLLHTLVSPSGEEGDRFGYSVARADDLDNDGCEDLVVGALPEYPGDEPPPGHYFAGTAYLFSGANGSLIDSLLSPDGTLHGGFGSSVSGAGDVDGDGRAELIVGDPYDGSTEHPRGGRAHVLSGADRSSLRTLVSPNEQKSGHFGWSVCGVGDLSKDGCCDWAVAAPSESLNPWRHGEGRVYVFSGADGTLLHTLVSPNSRQSGQFGILVASAGDVNTDGYADVLVGAPFEGRLWCAGRVYVFGGADGALLCDLISPNEKEFGYFGHSVSEAGDVNRDGYPDLLVGAPHEDPASGVADAGRAYVFSLRRLAAR